MSSHSSKMTSGSPQLKQVYGFCMSMSLAHTKGNCPYIITLPLTAWDLWRTIDLSP